MDKKVSQILPLPVDKKDWVFKVVNSSGSDVRMCKCFLNIALIEQTDVTIE